MDDAIRVALNQQSAAGAGPIPAVLAIENQQPNRIIILRRNLEAILQQLDKLQPKPHSQNGTIEELIDGLSSTQEAAAEFAKIAEVLSVMSDGDAALEVSRWFGRVFERYHKPEGFSGISSNADQDYFKFIGHELFVTFIALLIREQLWGMVALVLTEPIPMKYLPHEHRPGNADWRYASEHLPSILDEGRRRSRISLHADILNERHTTGGLAAIMPMEDFMAADYFLFLLGEMSSDRWSEVRVEWRPWSVLYLKHTPRFLRNAESKQVAEQLMMVFKISSVEEFRKRLAECAPRLKAFFRGGFWIDPFRDVDASRFGTR